MSIKDNPLVMVIEESILLKDSAQLILSQAMAEASLSRIERLVLIMVTEAESPMTASQMGRALGHSRQVIQRSANQLVDTGLLQKLPNPDHKASSLFAATARGKKYEQRLTNTLDDIAESLLSDPEKEMCLQVAKNLQMLRQRIESIRDEG